MTKNGKARTIIAIIAIVSLALTVLGVSGGIAAVWGSNKTKLETVQGKVATLKKDGCDPVRDVDKRCLVLEIQWKTINTSQQTLEAGQKEILKRLPK